MKRSGHWFSLRSRRHRGCHLFRRRGRDEANLLVNELTPLDELSARYTRGVVFKVVESEHGPDVLASLHEILRGYPGSCQVQLFLSLSDGTGVHLNSHKLGVAVSEEMRERVDDLLGPGHFKLLTASPGHSKARRGEPRETAPVT